MKTYTREEVILLMDKARSAQRNHDFPDIGWGSEPTNEEIVEEYDNSIGD